MATTTRADASWRKESVALISCSRAAFANIVVTSERIVDARAFSTKFETLRPSALAAKYAVGVAQNNPFVDGNKRTGFVVGALFLELAAGTIEEDAVRDFPRAKVTPA